MKSNECIHDVVPEERKIPPRFFHDNKRYNLLDVLEKNLDLSGMPFEYNSTSPTPLDPNRLTIHGTANYPMIALEFMEGELHLATAGLDVSDAHVRFSAMEIQKQHSHRMEKNAEAMQRWRNQAQASNTMVSRQEAEGIMQLRAGVAQAMPAVKLLSRNPDMGAIEVLKATRPFCNRRHLGARATLINMVRSVGDAADVAELTLDASPYRFFIDPDLGTIITKTNLGEVTIDGVVTEFIGRESFQGFDVNNIADNLEHTQRTLGPVEVALVPIDITSYIRVKQ